MLFFVGNVAKADAKLCVLRVVKCNKRLSPPISQPQTCGKNLPFFIREGLGSRFCVTESGVRDGG